MRSILLAAIVLVLYQPPGAQANVPSVTTDIPTTHSLVAIVMGELGSPALLVRSGASPHDYSLRPSDAEALSASDIVFWTSRELTPWLVRATESLAGNAVSVELMQDPNSIRYPYRSGTVFEPEGHDHSRLDHKQKSVAIPVTEIQSIQTEINPIDPHGWLDPVNGQRWLLSIADALGQLDKTNAFTYRLNARKAISDLDKLIATIDQHIAPVRGDKFVVFHDSYQYFEERFKLFSSGAISLGDASHPSVARLRSIQTHVRESGITCIFSEPQFSDRLISTVTEGYSVKLEVLDPLGTTQKPGAQLYNRVLLSIAESLSRCLQSVESQ